MPTKAQNFKALVIPVRFTQNSNFFTPMDIKNNICYIGRHFKPTTIEHLDQDIYHDQSDECQGSLFIKKWESFAQAGINIHCDKCGLVIVKGEGNHWLSIKDINLELARWVYAAALPSTSVVKKVFAKSHLMNINDISLFETNLEDCYRPVYLGLLPGSEIIRREALRAADLLLQKATDASLTHEKMIRESVRGFRP